VFPVELSLDNFRAYLVFCDWEGNRDACTTVYWSKINYHIAKVFLLVQMRLGQLTLFSVDFVIVVGKLGNRLYTGLPQKRTEFVLYALTSSNVDRFSNVFNCQKLENICNGIILSLKMPSHLKCVAALPCEMSVS